jgi:hypothetical protein
MAATSGKVRISKINIEQLLSESFSRSRQIFCPSLLVRQAIFQFPVRCRSLSSPVPLHQQAEKVIDSGLISTAGSSQPCKNICIETNRNSLLFGPIELADDIVRWYFPNFRDIGKIELPIRTRSEFLEFFPFFSR